MDAINDFFTAFSSFLWGWPMTVLHQEYGLPNWQTLLPEQNNKPQPPLACAPNHLNYSN